MAVAVRFPTPLPAPPHASRLAAEVRAGLLAPERWLPSKLFYDDRGSALFEDITRLPEYYQTRTEEAILAVAARDIVARQRPRELVELGSGAGRKIRLLLDAAGARRRPRVALFDINEGFVEASAARLAADYPRLDVRGLVGDFTAGLDALGPGGGRLVILFAGTIGNLHPASVPRFLRSVARTLAPGDGFLVGLDLVKDPARLEAAYNDAAGVTAAFNLNILEHLNHVLDADFDLARWRHRAFYDRRNAWIEMRVVATEPQRVRVLGAWLDLHFGAGDDIRTEYSCKYTRETFTGRLRGTGLALDRWYTDTEGLFGLALCRREAA